MNDDPLSGLEGLALRDLARVGDERLAELVEHVAGGDMAPLVGDQGRTGTGHPASGEA